MLCIEFPPVNTTGNYRSASFAQNLALHGFEPVVLTVDIESGKKTFNKSIDNSLLAKLSEKIKIYRFPISELSKFWKSKIGNALRIWLNVTDNLDKRWFTKNNREQIFKAIEIEKPSAIYVSLPPFSISNVAILLSKKYKLPLITDMRDAWSLWGTSPYSTRIHYKLVKNKEHQLFKASSIIIGVTQELVDDFKSQQSTIPPSKFKVIFNGSDISELKKHEISTSPNKAIYKIGYIGSFYYQPEAEILQSQKWWKRKSYKKLYYWPRQEQWIYRSPYFFLKTMAEFNANSKEIKIEFHHIGATPSWFNAMIKEFNLEANFVSHGFVDKSKVLQIQSSWDAVLATSEKIVGGNHFCLPSKSFDYLESGLPIIAFITSGAQHDFFSNFGQVIFCDPDNNTGSLASLKSLINDSNKLDFSYNIPSKFRRTIQTDLLIEAINEVV